MQYLACKSLNEFGAFNLRYLEISTLTIESPRIDISYFVSLNRAAMFELTLSSVVILTLQQVFAEFEGVFQLAMYWPPLVVSYLNEVPPVFVNSTASRASLAGNSLYNPATLPIKALQVN